MGCSDWRYAVNAVLFSRQQQQHRLMTRVCPLFAQSMYLGLFIAIDHILVLSSIL